MTSENLDYTEAPSGPYSPPQQDLIQPEQAPAPPVDEYCEPRYHQRRIALPVFLFIATCLSTLAAGAHYHFFYLIQSLLDGRIPPPDFFLRALGVGAQYAVPVMTILVCHEAGHFLQAYRYGVHCSLPYFIPMPISPIGTFGAVIAMEPRMGDRKALFDIGISGPLAGLIPTMIFCIWGLKLSHYVPSNPGGIRFGDPLLFEWLASWLIGPAPTGWDIGWQPIAFAGWVGLLVTSLNLLPIGQLDGGHILYALLRKKSYPVATFLLYAAGVAVVIGAIVYQYPAWILMLFLLTLMGPTHPPTANDDVPLGPVRIVLGWLTLAFIVIGLTPMPIIQ